MINIKAMTFTRQTPSTDFLLWVYHEHVHCYNVNLIWWRVVK